eukprot:COSAG02_NODE_7055_length_3206_cov_1.938204_2_plen_135_part_00
MSEEERGDPTFFPEHLHVLREKLEGNRKRSHGRSVGELPGRSRKRPEKRQLSAANGNQLPCACALVCCCFFLHVVGCNIARPRVFAVDTSDRTQELAGKLQHMEQTNGAMMQQVRRQRILLRHGVCFVRRRGGW